MSIEKQLGKYREKLKRGYIYVKPFIYFVGSFVSLFGLYEVLCYFDIDIMNVLMNPLCVFLLISIIAALLKFIFDLVKEVILKADPNSTVVETENDSLIEMLKEAEANCRWAEIIKLGVALSDFLWYTSRKKLRLVIGGFVEVAATQLNDYKTLASALIEDIGNTTMVLGYPEKGIEAIERGISIAVEHQFHYLVTRGYRNLANSYASKNDSQRSREYLIKAEESANKIPVEAQRLEALGGIEYARCKTEKHSFNYSRALEALDCSIQYYEELSKLYPETDNMNQDRLVKVYREKGIILYKQGKEQDAKAVLYEGLRRAQSTLNHENIVKCCITIVKILIESELTRDPGTIHNIEGMLNIAKQHIDKTDIPSIRKEYNDVSRRFELEKESVKAIGS